MTPAPPLDLDAFAALAESGGLSEHGQRAVVAACRALRSEVEAKDKEIAALREVVQKMAKALRNFTSDGVEHRSDKCDCSQQAREALALAAPLLDAKINRSETGEWTKP